MAVVLLIAALLIVVLPAGSWFVGVDSRPGPADPPEGWLGRRR